MKFSNDMWLRGSLQENIKIKIR